MPWDPDLAPDQLDHSDVTTLLPTPAPARRVETRRLRLVHESVTVGEAEMQSTLEWELAFEYPETWSTEDQQDALSAVVAEFLEGDVARFAFTKCLSIMGSVPNEVVPLVIDQLADIAEYETWLWRKQREPLGPPNVWDRQTKLPVTR